MTYDQIIAVYADYMSATPRELQSFCAGLLAAVLIETDERGLAPQNVAALLELMLTYRKLLAERSE